MGKHARLSLTPGAAIGIWQARGPYDFANEAMSRFITTRLSGNHLVTSLRWKRIRVDTCVISFMRNTASALLISTPFAVIEVSDWVIRQLGVECGVHIASKQHRRSAHASAINGPERSSVNSMQSYSVATYLATLTCIVPDRAAIGDRRSTHWYRPRLNLGGRGGLSA